MSRKMKSERDPELRPSAAQVHGRLPAVAVSRHRPQRSAAIATYRDLGARGLAPREAGNLTAYLRGLRPVDQGWTVAEINRLLFLRYLVERGRLGGHPVVDSTHIRPAPRAESAQHEVNQGVDACSSEG
jgi:hypothetical protein